MADDLDKEAHDSDFDFDDADDFGDDGSQSLGNVVQNNMATITWHNIKIRIMLVV